MLAGPAVAGAGWMQVIMPVPLVSPVARLPICPYAYMQICASDPPSPFRRDSRPVGRFFFSTIQMKSPR